ncbi:MAG: SPFH domain-containing protein [Gammaproteobacteria bacterium]
MDVSPGPLMLVVSVVLIFSFFLAILVLQYKRCPSNRVLVVYGKIAGQRAARCIHGGGTFVVPLLQSYAYMSLEPMTIDIELTKALSKKNIRVNVPSTFTIGISTVPEIMNNAAERLLGLDDQQISGQARDIILGQMRLVIATLSIEEINQDREKFLDLVNKNVNFELNKIGLEMINENIRDITDESGYIEALGQRAASEAVNTARVEVAHADREGAIGSATAKREMDVEVAEQEAQSVSGIKTAERDQRISVAELEAAGVAGEAESLRKQEVAVAEQAALTTVGRTKAEAHQRVESAEYEAAAVKGENESRAKIADYNAGLSQREAEAKRRGEVALAEAGRDVLRAQKEEEIARLEKIQIAQQTVERQKIEIEADAEAERLRRIAAGEADATLARYRAEADGIRQVLEAKASGYEHLMKVCGDRPDLVPALLLIEQLPGLVAEQVKAIQNLKIDKITVWDSGNAAGGGSSTAGFLKGLIGALPPVHELARQAGIELPEVLGEVADTRHGGAPAETPEPPRGSAGGTTADTAPPA